MSSIQTRLLRNKQRLEKKLKEKQEKRDRLGKEIFDFPNLTIPISIFTFMPAFIILIGTARYFTHNKNVISVSILLAIFGILMGNYLCRLEKRWFTFYGNKGIVKEEIKPTIKSKIIYLISSLIIIVVGTLIQNDKQLIISFAIFAIGCIYLALHKQAILWEMPPIYLLGFRKYYFIPEHQDKHAILHKKQTCVIRKFQIVEDNSKMEGTFLGNGWFYLRKKIEEETVTEDDNSKE